MYIATIEINEGRIDYELERFGAAIVGVPSCIQQEQIDDAFARLKSKYDDVSFDCDGDIVINA